MKKLTRFNLNRWFHWASIAGVLLLGACGTSNTAINARKDANPVAPTASTTFSRHELTDLAWKIANTESSAASEKVLPYLGIEGTPPPTLKKPGYRYASIHATDTNGGRWQLRMLALGLESISYDTQLLNEEKQTKRYLNVRLNRNVTCITPENVMASFGTAYEKMPAQVVAPISASSKFPAGQPPPPDNDIAGMAYGSLFHGNGSVWFTFEFHRCAESITLNSREKS